MAEWPVMKCNAANLANTIVVNTFVVSGFNHQDAELCVGEVQDDIYEEPDADTRVMKCNAANPGNTVVVNTFVAGFAGYTGYEQRMHNKADYWLNENSDQKKVGQTQG